MDDEWIDDTGVGEGEGEETKRISSSSGSEGTVGVETESKCSNGLFGVRKGEEEELWDEERVEREESRRLALLNEGEEVSVWVERERENEIPGDGGWAEEVDEWCVSGATGDMKDVCGSWVLPRGWDTEEGVW